MAGDPQLGFEVGVVVGGAIDAASKRPPSLGRLSDLRITGSEYGAMIPQVWGAMRLPGQIIWSQSQLTETSRRKGSKLLGTQVRQYSYSNSFAVGVCRGPISRFGKITAGDRTLYDPNAIPTSAYTVRLYLGDELQTADALIVANAGALTPAFRGMACVVFEGLPLADFGNQMPNPLSFEVINTDQLVAAFDHFNRPDGNVGTADSGQLWQHNTFIAQITSNKAHTTNTPGFPNWIDCGISDGFVQGTVATSSILGTAWLAARLSDENNCLECGCDGFASNKYEIRKRIAGSGTSLAVSTQAAVVGDVMKLSLSGATITLYVNGVQILQATDSFNQTATSYGFMGDESIDDWSVSPLSPTQSTVATILSDLFQQAGLAASQFDVTAGTDKVDGFFITDRRPVRDAIDPLLQAYDLYLTEVDGKIVLGKRGAGAIVSIPAGDLAARVTEGPEGEPPPQLVIPRLSELDLPARVEVKYFRNAFGNYLQGLQGATRHTKSWLQDPVTVELPLMLTEDHARQIAEKLLYRRWLERVPPQFVLPPRYSYLAPGDVVTLPVPGGTANVRLTQMDLALPGPIQCTAVLDDAAVLTQSVSGGVTTNPAAETTDALTTLLTAWSGTALQNTDASSVGFYASASGAGTGYWPGAALYWSRDGGSTYQPLVDLTDAATLGTTLTALPAATGATGSWDDTNTVDVSVAAGTAPVSTSDSAVLSGDNAAIVGDEVIQFGTVTPLTATTYRLSHLLRARRGTDGHETEHVSGERFALLDAGWATRVSLDASMKNKTVLLKAVTSGQAVATTTAVSLWLSGDELKTYSPVQIAGTRDGSNNLSLSWVRRTRVSIGLQDGLDEPLGETSEAYNCYVRAGVTKAVSGISVASSAVITSTAHGYSVNNVVLIRSVAGMTPINGMVATVTAVTANTLTVNIDSSQWLPWSSGGTVEKILRTIATTTTAASYSAASQTADFGSPQPSIGVAIYQLGAYGNGTPGLATV